MFIDLTGNQKGYTTKTPPGGKCIGTVQRDDGLIGALFFIVHTGAYMLINRQVWMTLDHNDVSLALIDANANRPPADAPMTAAGCRMRGLTLDDATVAVFKRAGSGNISAGARLIAKMVDGLV